MREILFRFWDSFNGAYTYAHNMPSLRDFFELYDATVEGENIPILEQYTGMIAEGHNPVGQRPIYDGTLIINYSRNGGKPHPVIWSETHGGWVGKYRGTEYAISYELHEIEVVGDIHTNPELLNQET